MGGIQGWDANGILREILTDALGRLLVGIDLPLPAGTNNIGDVDVLSIAAGTNLIGRVDARSGDKLHSIKAVYAEAVVNLNTPAAGGTLTAATVPANTLRHVIHAVAWNANTNPAVIEMYGGFTGIVSLPVARVLLPGVTGMVFFNGHLVMRPGDNCFATFGAGALNDDTHFRLAGYDESF